VERARAVQLDFEVTTATAASVAAICRRLDGLPLAIELAAARLHVLPVEEILARLDDRYRLLRRGARPAGDRHQALQATMDWSHGLLDPAGQALLRRVAVFAGGWDLSAAEQVCAGDAVAAEAVLELLDELLERSLLHVHEVGGVPRYGLLETVRQYGLQQLERSGETAAVRDRHLAWCATLAEQAAPALLGPEQAAWLARLEREHDNLRGALQWALERSLSTLALRLATGLWQFWRIRGYYSEGRRWLAAALALAAPDDAGDATSTALRAGALDGAAWLAEVEHDFAQAAALFAQSGALRRALGQDERVTSGLITAGMEARARGDYAHATALLEQSLAQHRAEGNREGIMQAGLGASLSQLALVLGEQGAYARARALYEECLLLHRELGDREGMGRAVLGLGDLARDQGDAAQVRASCAESLTLFGELSPRWAGFSLNNLALAAYLDGDLTLAAQQAEESVALFRGLQAEPSLAEVLITLGRVRGAQGETATAQSHLREALRLAWAQGPRLVVAAALAALGVQAVRQGQAQQGVHLLAAAARLHHYMGLPVRPADRPAIEEALATARTTLGDGAFDEAWASGQTQALEQIVTRAVVDPENSQV
jgi:non-specific serine/threonine protein kinase